MSNIIEVKNLVKNYKDVHAVNDISFTVEEGSFFAFLGINGAGKSTLFSHFNGLTEPTSGCVKIEGKPISFEKDELLKVRQKVGIVFQDPNDQLFAPTVKEDIAFGPMNLGLSYDEVEKRVEDALKMVGMENYEDKTPHHLSGGQQKRIAIAGIIAMKPELMILDEPTAGLDPDGVEKVLNIMNQLNEEGMTLIISSHDIDMISKYADKIFVLYNGEIIESGNKNKIFSDMELLKKAHLRTPITTEILYNLKESGLNVNTEKISVKDTCAEIIKAKQINE